MFGWHVEDWGSDRHFAQKGGGTAILVKDSIPFEVVYTPSSRRNLIIEYTIISINLKIDQKLYILSLYANNICQNVFITELKTIFEKLKLNHPIMAGYLNARHINFGDRANNLKGRLLTNWLADNQIEYKAVIYSTASPSYIPNDTFLDYCITDSRLHILDACDNKIKATDDFDSDHRALVFTVEITNFQENLITSQHRYMFKKTNWYNFSKHLEAQERLHIPSDRNLSNDAIDLRIKKWSLQITDSIRATVPCYILETGSLRYNNAKIEKLKRNKS